MTTTTRGTTSEHWVLRYSVKYSVWCSGGAQRLAKRLILFPIYKQKTPPPHAATSLLALLLFHTPSSHAFFHYYPHHATTSTAPARLQSIQSFANFGFTRVLIAFAFVTAFLLKLNMFCVIVSCVCCAAKCTEHHEIFTIQNNEHIRGSLMLIVDTQ